MRRRSSGGVSLQERSAAGNLTEPPLRSLALLLLFLLYYAWVSFVCRVKVRNSHTLTHSQTWATLFSNTGTRTAERPAEYRGADTVVVLCFGYVLQKCITEFILCELYNEGRSSASKVGCLHTGKLQNPSYMGSCIGTGARGYKPC